jgi:hypothetical protein
MPARSRSKSGGASLRPLRCASVAGIHVLNDRGNKDGDGRNKSGQRNHAPAWEPFPSLADEHRDGEGGTDRHQRR